MRWWRAGWRSIVSVAASATIGWCAFAADRPVPILDWFDLGIHEVGHMIGFALPELLMFMAGSFAQVAFPAAMTAYFLWFRRDPASGGFCLAWAGTSAWDVSVYVADAPVQALPLIGGGQHDWAYILGHFDAVDQAARVAGWIETLGAGLVLVGIAIALVPLARPRPRPVSRRVRPAGLPVREARGFVPGEPEPPPAPSPAEPSGASGEPIWSLPPDPSAATWGSAELLPEDPFSIPRESKPAG